LGGDLFSELYDIYDDLGGVQPLEDDMYEIMENLASKLEKLNEEDQEDLMKEIRNIYRHDRTALRDFMFYPVRGYR